MTRSTAVLTRKYRPTAKYKNVPGTTLSFYLRLQHVYSASRFLQSYIMIETILIVQATGIKVNEVLNVLIATLL